MGGQIGYANGGPFSWQGGRGPFTPLSTCEAELVQATKAAVVAKGSKDITNFMQVGTDTPVTIFCDNISAVMVSESNSSSKRMKHVATRIAFMREYVENKYVQLIHIGTHGQILRTFLLNHCPPQRFIR